MKHKPCPINDFFLAILYLILILALFSSCAKDQPKETLKIGEIVSNDNCVAVYSENINSSFVKLFFVNCKLSENNTLCTRETTLHEDDFRETFRKANKEERKFLNNLIYQESIGNYDC